MVSIELIKLDAEGFEGAYNRTVLTRYISHVFD